MRIDRILSSRRMFRRMTALLTLLVIALGASACGTDDSGPKVDPQTAVTTGLGKVATLKTGTVDAALGIALSGPLTTKITIDLDGPFDFSDAGQPGYALAGAVKFGDQPGSPFQLAAKSGTRYAVVEKQAFKYKSKSSSKAPPLNTLITGIGQLLQKPVSAGTRTVNDEELDLYKAPVDVAKFRAVAPKVLSGLIAPGARTDVLSSGQIGDVLEQAVQKANATVGVGADGLARLLEVKTDGSIEVLSTKERVQITLSINLLDPDKAVTITVPPNAKTVKSAAELDAQIARFLTTVLGGATSIPG